MRVFFGLLRLENMRQNSTTKVLLFPRAAPPAASASGGRASGRTSASQLLPELKNRWGDHVPVRRNGVFALRCEWCKLQSNVMKTTGRSAPRPRETRLVCSHCTRAEEDTHSRGCRDIALCNKLRPTSTEAGATCFFLYHQYVFGSTPVASGTTPAAAAKNDDEPAAPQRLDDAMDDTA